MELDRKKNIAIAISGNLLTDQRIQKVATSLKNNGFQVSIFYRNYLKYKGNKTTVKFDEYITVPIDTIIKTGIGFYLLFNIKLFLKLVFQKYSYYYAVDSDTLPAFIALKWFKKSTLIFDSHEYFTEVPELSNEPLKRKTWHIVTLMGVKRSKLNITVAPMLASQLSQVYKKPFISILNAPIYLETQNTPQAIPPIILYQGALNKGRCLELLIDSAPLIPKMNIVIVGEGDLSEFLRKKAEKYSNVIFKGIVTGEQLKELTQSAWIGFNLLDTSISKSYYYSLSNKFFDYMHAGIPSISSKAPEYNNITEKYECGICINNDKDSFVKAINELKDNNELYEKLKQNTIIASRAFTWQAEEKKLIEAIQQIE